MRLRYKLSALAAIIGAILLWLHIKHPVKGVVLPPGKFTESGLTLPDYGHGNIITVKQQGNKQVTTITPKITGFPFDIGLSGAIGGGTSDLYLTTEVWYYRHMELLIGGGITYPVVHPRVMIAVGYRLPWKRVDNISLFVGHNTQNVIVGIYARFGSN
jgi:hypothetical protein